MPRTFFARDAPKVAPDLVGRLLRLPAQNLVARIVEVEAYHQDEPACHAHRGCTPRTAVLCGPPGHLYVYFTYGMHWCANVVTGADGEGQGCLLRAAEPLSGLAEFRARRGAAAERDLLRGPARLAQAFGLDRSWGGVDLCGPDAALHIADDGARPAVDAGPRTGVVMAPDLPWRFVAAGSSWASRYKRHPRAIQGRRTGG